ncbi:MAG: phosphotransferase [Xanthomonadales bacterium]|nr:phosphotransferase [Xanthomonadales bacterium]
MNSADHQLIKRDRSLHGLAVLMNPQPLLEAMSGHSETEDISLIKPDYIRYKPHANCIARFQIVNGGETGSAYAKVTAEDAQAKFEKVRARLASHPLTADRVHYYPQWRLMFAMFPADAKLSSLARLLEPETVGTLSQRIFKHQKPWHTTGIEILNYKPERRLVAKFNAGDGRSAVVKFYSGKGFERIRHTRKHLVAPQGILTPGWIGGSKSHRAVALNWLEGDTLRDAAIPEDEKHVLAGQVAAHFHNSPQKRLKPLKASLQAAALEGIAQQFTWLLPELSDSVHSLLPDLVGLVMEDDGQRVPLHGDYYDKQVVVGADRPALIDCDQARMGNPLEDLGCYLAHLERHNTRLAQAADTAHRDALLEGYQSVRPGLDDRQLDLWTAVALFRLLHHPFRDRDPNWPSRTRTLLDRCFQLAHGRHA